MVAAYHGKRTDLATLRRSYCVSLKGMTLAGVIEAAEMIGLAGRPLRLEPVSLARLRLPAILHWDLSHYVVLKRIARGGRIVIQDPARGERTVQALEVSNHFSGIALELTPSSDFQPGGRVVKQRLTDLLGPWSDLTAPLAQMLVLSAMLQAYVLAGPFYMQLAVDEGVVSDDRGLLSVLAIGFGLAMLFNAVVGLLRSSLLVYLQSRVAYDIGSRLFAHLLRLPLTFFERRHIGDLVSRFSSIEPIRNLLAEGLIAALVDGAMAVLTGAMVFVYSTRLGVVVLAALMIYGALRLAFYRMFHQRSLDLVHARAQENSVFIETARAIQSIKTFNREGVRRALWCNRYAEVMVTNAGVERLKGGFKALNDVVFGAENILVIWLGALGVINGRLTIGMLFAFVAYKQQFIDKAVRLIEKAIEFRMLDLHLDRLADIARAEPEPSASPKRYSVPPTGRIELRDLSFRYGPGEAFVFEQVSLRIAPGDYVAITGPSGGGKTTLLKIMLGLLEPTRGEVLIDDQSLAAFGTRALRDHVGVVMQDDQLLSGSIADNICFFDQSLDHAHLQRCAEIACVHDEIMRMPMAYDSLIGDMGSSLSGGQRQRILLARALYRRPRILFMDEGTSHLDIAIEARVNAAVRGLGLTRIIIAHRPDTIASADRCVTIKEGRVTERSRHDPRQTTQCDRGCEQVH